MIKHAIAILLTVLLMLCLFTSCAGKTDEPDGTITQQMLETTARNKTEVDPGSMADETTGSSSPLVRPGVEHTTTTNSDTETTAKPPEEGVQTNQDIAGNDLPPIWIESDGSMETE